MKFRNLSIYYSEDGKFIVLPTGVSEKWYGAILDLEIFYVLGSDSSDEVLETILHQAEKLCFQKTNDDLKKSSIEKLFNKSHLRTIKGMKLVVLMWQENKGYFVRPTANKGKEGFIHMEDKILHLDLDLQPGDLAKAVRTAVELSTN